MSEYPHLLSPLRIGTTEVRNRIMQTAHAKMYSQNGHDTQRDIDYQVARAKGGAGLLITGKLVSFCEKNGLQLHEVKDADMAAISPKLTPEVRDVLSVSGSIRARAGAGGTALPRVLEQITALRKFSVKR